MRILVLDTETTGLNQAEGDKIIEIALLTYDSETEQLLDSYVQRINPKRAIDPNAQAVHGISIEDLKDCPVWEDCAETVLNTINSADRIVAHNIGFDIPFVVGELDRVGLTPNNKPLFCTMENGRWATFNGKRPKLKELCFALGVHYDDQSAHAADYDVDVTAKCLFAGIKRGFYNLESEAND